jgi:hypothetical protein
MVEWLAGNRIRGTSTERTSADFNARLISPNVGGWKELGRTTLGSAGDTISVTGLADKRYYMILSNNLASGSINSRDRINNDSGSNYAYRYSEDGASDGSGINKTSLTGGGTVTTPRFDVSYWSNLSTKEKLGIRHTVLQSTAGAGNAPERNEAVNKWTNTSDAIDSYYVRNENSSGSFDTGSECVVLGWDEDDTHTDNFWEELASDTHTGADTDTFTSSTFTAKKYLWIQCFLKIGTTSGVNGLFRFNGDSGSNYSHRREQNGATDITQINQTNGILVDSWSANGLINIFVINNSANEKLAIAESVFGETTGSGTAPKRSQSVSKWSNTTDQITSFSLVNTWNSDAFASGSIIKVWGHD